MKAFKMNLKFILSQKYKSFPPDFEFEFEGPLVIISGVNGSGKTQIIDIIKGYKLNDINTTIPRTLSLYGTDVESGAIVSKSFRDYHGLTELTQALATNTTVVRDQIHTWYAQVRLLYRMDNQVVHPNYREVAKLAKKLLIDKFGEEAFNQGKLTREDIKQAIPGDFVLFEDDIFANKIGELFFNHASLVYNKQAEAGRDGSKFDYNSIPPSPWRLLNELFAKLNFAYRFKDNYLRVDDEIDEQPAIYPLKVDGTIDLSQKRAMNELSDGEKALISLTFAVIANDYRQPKLLLLDEFDATLNPSLIESFFTIIQDFFVAKGIQVLLVTHSSATLSLAPENATFYEVYKATAENIRIIKVERDQYLELSKANKKFYDKITDQRTRLIEIKAENDKLSSLLEQVKNASNDKIQLITEGNNIAHIEKAITVLNPELFEKVRFVTGAENVTGKQQMKQAFEIMSKVSLDKKVLFVWDVDAANMVANLEDSATCKKFYFYANVNNKTITSGIENLYPEEIFSKDVYNIIEKPKDNYGGQTTITSLDKNRVFNKIHREKDPEIFKNFTFLMEVIKSYV